MDPTERRYFVYEEALMKVQGGLDLFLLKFLVEVVE